MQPRVYIGFDSREPVASEVAAYSIRKRSKNPVHITYLKHRDLRKSGHFNRPWHIQPYTGENIDSIDKKPFSTEFSHTRFLVPALMKYKGWALFMDADMIFLSGIEKLFQLCDDRYAVMVVKHDHKVKNSKKMDDRKQEGYFRKNWSSFVLWNCAHNSNKWLTPERVNNLTGSDLHSFCWLGDSLIGSLPFSYNYISGISPAMSRESGRRPDVIHYTEGGPWFPECRNVAFSQHWLDEYEDYQRNMDGEFITHVPTMVYDKGDPA